jgi:hypothetical protein
MTEEAIEKVTQLVSVIEIEKTIKDFVFNYREKQNNPFLIRSNKLEAIKVWFMIHDDNESTIQSAATVVVKMMEKMKIMSDDYEAN